MNARHAVRRVFAAAAKAKGFFDLSDTERIAWMIGEGFRLGKRAARRELDRLAENAPQLVEDGRKQSRGSSRGSARMAV